MAALSQQGSESLMNKDSSNDQFQHQLKKQALRLFFVTGEEPMIFDFDLVWCSNLTSSA